MTTRARVIRRETLGEERTAVVPLCAAGLSVPQRRRIARERIEGALDAERIVASATKQAEAILSRARAAAEATADEAAAEARKSEHAKLSAQYLALHKAEEDRADRELDRGIALGVALAERLIGAALELEPSRIAALARQALAEARGARQAVIEAHPLDAEALALDIASLGLSEGSVEVRAKEGLARGELCLHTDLGTLDAKLTPRLERLAKALRDALR